MQNKAEVLGFTTIYLSGDMYLGDGPAYDQGSNKNMRMHLQSKSQYCQETKRVPTYRKTKMEIGMQKIKTLLILF